MRLKKIKDFCILTILIDRRFPKSQRDGHMVTSIIIIEPSSVGTTLFILDQFRNLNITLEP